MQQTRSAFLVEVPHGAAIKEHDRNRGKEKQRHIQAHQLIKTLVVTDQQQRKLHETGDDHQRVTDIAGQAKKHFQLDAQRQRRAPDSSVQLEPNLQHALGPTPLLRFEGVNVDRNFRRGFFVQQIDKPPAHQLRAKAQVRVFGERVVLPAAAHLNRFAPPDSRGAVEIKKVAAPVARRLFDHKMTVEHDRLQPSQKVVRTVDVRPAHLRAADNRVGEVMDQLAQEIRLGHKVGIEDRNQIAFRRLHAMLQRARFESRAIVAMKVMNIETGPRVSIDRRARDVDCLVGGIVQHLNLQTVARVIDLNHRLHQTLDDIHLVKERKLHGDARQFCFRELAFRLWRKLRVPPELDDLLNAIRAIDREDGQDAEINNQHGPVESVELVQRTDVGHSFVNRVAEAWNVRAKIS